MIIIGDTTCQLSKEKINKMGVEIMKYPIFVNKEPYPIETLMTMEDRIKLRELVLEKKNIVSTSGIEPNEIRTLIEKHKNEEIIIMTQAISRNSAATAEAIRAVVKEFPDSRIEVIDSNHLAGGYGIQLIKAAEEIKKGKSLRETADALIVNRSRTYHLACIYDLFYLNRTGRIGYAKAVMGTAMKILPLLKALEDQPWVIESVGKARTYQQANQKFADIINEDIIAKKARKASILINYCGPHEKDAQHMKELIEKQEWETDVEIHYSNAPNIVHMGPNFIDIGYMIHED